jgi:PAS domain S-box-containing protein
MEKKIHRLTPARIVMLKILDRSITLQLLVFYGLFILPLLAGGVELYLFQRDALQQSAQRADLGLAKAIALEVETNVRAASEIDTALAKSQAASQLDLLQLTSTFATAYLSHPDISLYFICTPAGKVLISYPSTRQTAAQQASLCVSTQQTLRSEKPFISSGWVSPTAHTNVVSITNRVSDTRGRFIGLLGIEVSLGQFASRLMVVQQQLSSNGEVRIWIIDDAGRPLANTEGVPLQAVTHNTSPALKNALRGQQGNLIAHEQQRDWLYSYVPIVGTHWTVVVQRPTDDTFATVISFQNSLIIALVMLLLGAGFFWFALHGWVVAPLAKLAQAAAMIKPDQAVKVTDGPLLASDRGRIDEIGNLITAFSTMEEEIHSLFRSSDEQSQARLHTLDAIMRSMDEGVLLESPERQIVYANQSFIQFVGISPQELLPDSFDDKKIAEKLLTLIEDKDAYQQATQRAENESGPYETEFQVHGYYNQVGQLIPVQRDIRMRLFQVRDQAGQLIGRGKIFRDVTRHNEAERVKKNLLAIVSHELRTPLTSIKGYATSLLATDVELDSTLQEHFLRRIVEEGDLMAELVTNLLEMSQLEAGTLKLSPDLYRLDRLIEQTIPADKRHRLRVVMPEQVPLVYVDRRRIEVVLRNVLENARRYAGRDAAITISVWYGQDADEGGLHLRITDNGPGIPSHLTERIFDRFYQIDGDTKRSSSGVGLGLSICRGFIEAHGGRIYAENRTDGATGAVFHIWLPPKILHSHDSETYTFGLHKVL